MGEEKEKPLFIERMKKLMGEEYGLFMETNKKEPPKYIRCNTLKISHEELKKKLEHKGWNIIQKYKGHPEIMLIENELKPGELGNSEEHKSGLYYVQELTSMMPALVLNPDKDDAVLDLCASPGSKTTQMASLMENKGILIANDDDFGRIGILNLNMERCGVSNSIMTKEDAVQICNNFKKLGYKFDKILLDASCSGEGNIRKDKETLKRWNIKMIKKFGRIQKKMISSVVPIMKEDGILVYSTCTHSPEECESVVSFAVNNFSLKIDKARLMINCRKGIKEWGKEIFAEGIENCMRIYPQDNDSEGFFIAKLRKA